MIAFSRAGAIASLVLGTVLAGVFVYLVVSSTHIPNDGKGVNGTSIKDCIEKFSSSGGPKQVQELAGLNNFCYYYVAYQLSADQGIIRRDDYLFQRNENVVLMYMVVLITFAGVVLAGVQLLASYKLALLGKGELAGGGEIIYSAGGASFKSSVVGLVILALSFAFFLVFVLDVYKFDPEQRGVATANPALSAANMGWFAPREAPKPTETSVPNNNGATTPATSNVH